MPNMNRRQVLATMSVGMASILTTSLPRAHAHPNFGAHSYTHLSPQHRGAAQDLPPGQYLWWDDFDGPAGSAPDRSKWTISNFRTPIRKPVGWDRPEYFYQYRDSRENVFLDGNSNLVLRGTHDGKTFHGGLVYGNWRGAIGTTWEARIKLNCQTAGAWPAWWLSNDTPGQASEIDLMEWYGNGDWPSGTTVHANPWGTAFETCPIPVDSEWHNWRVHWDYTGMSFWQDYTPGMQPYFRVNSTGIENIEEPGNFEWVFNDPDYTVFPVLNLAIGGSGGGDARQGVYPADMLVDWVRVF